MLRTTLLCIAILVIFAGLMCFLAGATIAWPMTMWGTGLLVAVLIERWRYQQPHRADTGEWQKTDEKFIDPETGKLTQVLYHSETGERRYVHANDDSGPRS